MSSQQSTLRMKMETLKKATDVVSEAVADMEACDAVFGCAAVLAFYLSEFKPNDRALLRDRIVAMLHEADKGK